MASFSTFGGATRLFAALALAAVTISGFLRIDGPVISNSVVKEAYSAFTTTTQNLAAIQNPATSTPRVLNQVGILFTTSTNTGGSAAFTISLSSTPNTTGTLLYSGTVPIATNGLYMVTPTSTVQTTSSVWNVGQYLNCRINTPTTTLTGACIASFL